MKYFPGDDRLWNEECKYIDGYCQGFGLDVGAGYRTLSPSTLTNDKFVSGCDFSYDADKLEFANNYFDYIYASHVLEHTKDILKSVKEWLRVVKIGGYVVIVGPDKRFTPSLGMVNVDNQHTGDYEFEEIREIMKLLDNADIVNKNPSALPNFSYQIILRKTK